MSLTTETLSSTKVTRKNQGSSSLRTHVTLAASLLVVYIYRPIPGIVALPMTTRRLVHGYKKLYNYKKYKNLELRAIFLIQEFQIDCVKFK